MQLNSDSFDLWVWCRDGDVARYLLLRTSQEKADRWFNGSRFWQIPGEKVAADETLALATRRCLSDYRLQARSVCAVEHTYSIYNLRTQAIELILVLAAEVPQPTAPRIGFRGLTEGLEWTRRYASETARVLPELRIW